MIEIVVWCLACALPVAAAVLALRRRDAIKRVAEPTFVFADLAGYTALTERAGDQAAANLAREFRRTMCALSREHGAHQIKSMGDGVMIVAQDPAAAVGLAAHAVAQVGKRPDLLPVRVGVHTGPAVRRGCDWYGSSVNVAARLAREAEPNEALVSAATRAAARENLDERLTRRRELVLHGLNRPISVWRLA
jgi:class 3 adenylate cyclase